jgi:hypothetical protein
MGRWPDARIAEAIDASREAPGTPPSAQAWWMACSDEYALRWFISGQLARVLDEANVAWREFIIGQGPVPVEARPYLPNDASSEIDEASEPGAYSAA